MNIGRRKKDYMMKNKTVKMTGEQIMNSIQKVVQQKNQALAKLKNKYDKEQIRAEAPFNSMLHKLRSNCPHEAIVDFVDGHNGDEYYKCKWCGAESGKTTDFNKWCV